MPTVQAKICGITNLADARYCAAMGADYLGFIQYDKSPRFVEADTAKQIIEWVAGPRSVGVFVDEDPEVVNRAAAETGFELVQLHGTESPEYCSLIKKPVIKAIRVKSDDSPDHVRAVMQSYRPHVFSFLLDTHIEGVHGGTGRTFPWKVAAAVSDEFPVFLAGGLNPSNIVEAVQTVNPVAVDVSSGVEHVPGRKNFEALDVLFAALTSLQASPSNAV